MAFKSKGKNTKRPPTKGQKEESAKKQFLQYGLHDPHTTRTGKGGDVWWRDRVLFAENHPSWRVLDLPQQDSAGRKQIVLIRYHNLGERSFPGVTERYVILPVPDIGVFSRYEGDLLDDANLHHRMRFIYIRQMQWHLDVTAQKLNGAQLYENNGREANDLHKELDKMIEGYHRYEHNLRPGWPALAIDYRVKLQAIIESKVGAYRDPKAVLARQRAAARKTAVAALGLDGKEEAA